MMTENIFVKPIGMNVNDMLCVEEQEELFEAAEMIVKNVYNEDINQFCIIVPSHVSNCERLKYMKDCLQSLLCQSTCIQIYLSISFEDNICERCFDSMMSRHFSHDSNLIIIKRKNKTAQFRHIMQVYNEYRHKHQWFMFCDDDDTYHMHRVTMFVYSLHFDEDVSEEKIYIGMHDCYYDIKTAYYEYWAYCLNTKILEPFLKHIDKYNVTDHVYCDCLIVKYIESLMGGKYFIINTKLKLYNHNTLENSVCGRLKKNMDKININFSKIQDDESLNKFIGENMNIYLNNIFVSLTRDYTFDRCINKSGLPMIRINKHNMSILTQYYLKIKTVCDSLHDIKIQIIV